VDGSRAWNSASDKANDLAFDLFQLGPTKPFASVSDAKGYATEGPRPYQPALDHLIS
jgi:hypothetical protein